jgi:hypothetical protein
MVLTSNDFKQMHRILDCSCYYKRSKELVEAADKVERDG